ncbi:MAG: peptidoglycan-binding protein [Chthoniobacterales bacterium]
MKKFTSLLIGCSLMLAGAAIAQQPEEQPTPAEKQGAEKGKGHGGDAKPGQKPEAGAPAKEHAAPAQEHGAKMEQAPKEPRRAPNAVVKPVAPAVEQHGGKHAADAAKAAKAEVTPKAEATPKVAASEAPVTKPAVSAPPAGKEHGKQHGKDVKAPAATASATPMATATPVTKAAPSATPMTKATVAATASPVASATPAATVAASATPAATTTASAGPIPTPKPNTAAATKKPDVQKVQQIRTEHANFAAQPNLQVAPAVTFNPSYRVEGSDRWQGPQYEVYRSYRPERHDEGYYRSHYSQVELIGGGYYYENNNYWYPAWGYNPRNEYYAYDGPIYAGHRGERVDRVIADVQASLKDMGYYTGSVDGLLGPLTRKALIGYQEDAGLTATATIDEPTLVSLNMSS